MINLRTDLSPCGPDDLVLANKVLFKYDVVYGFGHVSLRCQDNPQQFWLARNCAPLLVGIDDIIRHDLDGEMVEGSDHRLYLERFIHAAAFQWRDDISAVVHSHLCSMVAFSVSKAQKLVSVWQMAGFFGRNVPIFDTEDKFGRETDLLITDMEKALALADCLVDSDVALTRGHGATIYGRTLPEAVYRAIYAELNAKILLNSANMGALKALSAGECIATVDRLSSQIGRAWDLWVREVEED